MPAYDYRCTSCEQVFEINRSMSATGDEHCPLCGSVGARLFSPVGVAFKGTGFHNTDYKPRPKDPSEPKPAEKPATPAACPASTGTSCAGCAAAE